MGRDIRHRAVASAIVLLLAGAAALGVVHCAWAQVRAATAEVKGLTGRVEIQRKGEQAWTPATLGAQLAEGDNIRAWAGSSARLDLPDGSTLFVAENSRLAIGKLEFDQQNQAREALFHLVVGKVRAIVSQTALRLVKARQSNFSITTDTAVAAVRGTDFEVTYDDKKQVTRIAVLPESDPLPKGDGS